MRPLTLRWAEVQSSLPHQTTGGSRTHGHQDPHGHWSPQPRNKPNKNHSDQHVITVANWQHLELNSKLMLVLDSLSCRFEQPRLEEFFLSNIATMSDWIQLLSNHTIVQWNLRTESTICPEATKFETEKAYWYLFKLLHGVLYWRRSVVGPQCHNTLSKPHDQHLVTSKAHSKENRGLSRSNKALADV